MVAKQVAIYSDDPEKAYVSDWAIETNYDLSKQDFARAIAMPGYTEESLELVKSRFGAWLKAVCNMHDSIKAKPYFGETNVALADIVILSVFVNYAFNKSLNEPVLQQAMEQVYEENATQDLKDWYNLMSGPGYFGPYLERRKKRFS
jgi:hypothetical protein